MPGRLAGWAGLGMLTTAAAPKLSSPAVNRKLDSNMVAEHCPEQAFRDLDFLQTISNSRTSLQSHTMGQIISKSSPGSRWGGIRLHLKMGEIAKSCGRL